MTFDEFDRLVGRVLGGARRPNEEQRECLAHDPATPLLIVAGPGSGKTTVLVLRALRHVLVDGLPPERILITTFTRKAAKEIRTRLIEWGTPLLDAALAQSRADGDRCGSEFLIGVDVNRFVTGTLDGICEESLSRGREPDERALVVVEAFAANQVLARKGEVFATAQRVGRQFAEYLALYSNTGDPPSSLGDMTRVVRTIVDRLGQDEVDLKGYAALGPHHAAKLAICEILERYTAHLRSTGQMDFAILERIFFERLTNGRVPDALADLGAMLVDEYQDTNPLQERIYFKLAGVTGAALTVVGDDDQSLYRFRGATIELFRDFRQRAAAELGGAATRLLYLVENYRSTPEVVGFFNAFIHNDPDFAPARIDPPKPLIRSNQPSANLPVLGMFRADAATLAVDLASFLEQVFRRGGRPGDPLLPEAIRAAAAGGDLGDAVMISHSVGEFGRPFRGNPPKARFPWLLRRELEERGISAFNPRGRALKDIAEVGRALGLLLECIDPSSAGHEEGPIVEAMAITSSARAVLRRWREEAQAFIATDPPAVLPNGLTLRGVVNGWRQFGRGLGKSMEWPLLDLLYSLLPWMPMFQDDPEHQVYLEAISRAAAQAATFSPYRSLLLRDEPHRTRSKQAVVRDVLAPIADDLVEVDEDIMPSVPRNRLNFMTIHQAKGLEFPLVIVDIASAFKSNHPTQKFWRYPEEPSPVTLLEDDLAGCTPIGPLRTRRTALQRSFEDLIRLNYVAFSRPQSALLLVGSIPCLRYDTTVRHVATFWRQDGTWPWRTPVKGRPPPMANNLPITCI